MNHISALSVLYCLAVLKKIISIDCKLTLVSFCRWWIRADCFSIVIDCSSFIVDCLSMVTDWRSFIMDCWWMKVTSSYNKYMYRSATVNLNMVNSKFHLIQSYCEIFVYNCPNISCIKYTVNLNFHLIRSKTLLMNDFKFTVPDL